MNSPHGPGRFAAAIAVFDAANADDPNQDLDANGHTRPKEVLYAQRMSSCLAHVAPTASETVRLAARSQHIRRWATTTTGATPSKSTTPS